MPAPVTVGERQAPAETAFVSPPGGGDGGVIPLPFWLLAAVAAVGAASPRARSLLSRGGSTRATVGPSRMVLIHDESSPKTYRFAMNVPDGGRTAVNPDGSATVYDKDGNAVRQVARPWAFDAAGRPQKTWYTVDENGDLIQHVEPSDNALYPILADPTEEDMASLQEASERQSSGDYLAAPPFVAGPLTQEQQQARSRTEARDQGLAVAQGTTDDGAPATIVGDPETMNVSMVQTAPSPSMIEDIPELQRQSDLAESMDKVTAVIQGPGLEEDRAGAAHRSQLRENGYIVFSQADENGVEINVVINPQTGTETLLRPGDRIFIDPATGQERVLDKAAASAYRSWLSDNDRDQTLNWSGRSAGALGDGLDVVAKGSEAGSRERSFYKNSGKFARRFGLGATILLEVNSVYSEDKTVMDGLKDAGGVTAFSMAGAGIGAAIGGPAAPVTAAIGSIIGGLAWDLGKGRGWW
ncbi:MAG: hypothetical protein WBA98_16400 [Gordonia sp. (in: high G+C Gram-positive bacteria)]|uniref:hypothetical protein n=2 Tax=Gordonia sp. (in: high G+C Gram-positive bacteria) TaxID=84139 RepID=UPI003C75E3FB